MRFSTIALFLVGTVGAAQNTAHTLSLSYKTGYTNDDYTFYYEARYERWESWIVNKPLHSLNLDYSYTISNHVVFSTGLSYDFITIIYEDSEFLDGGWVFNDTRPLESHRGYISPHVGIGLFTEIGRKLMISGSVYLSIQLPVSSYDLVEKYTGEQFKLKPTIDDVDFQEAIMYGPGVDVQLQWSPWRYGKQKNLAVLFKMDAQLLYQSEAALNPKFNFGPEAGLVFRF